MSAHFGDVLTKYIESRQRTSGQLSDLSGVPKQTIVSWREGRVKRPRTVVDILRVAQALHLSTSEVNQLLQSAKHDTIATQNARAAANEEDDLLAISQFWMRGEKGEEGKGRGQGRRQKQGEEDHQSQAQVAKPPFTAPRPTHAFVGRQQLIADVQATLSQSKVTALWGMPGIGKSEVAKMVAHSLREKFPDGVLWASLNNDSQSTLTEPERINSILGNWLDLCGWQIGGEKQSDETIETRSQTLRTILNSRAILIVLDNVENSETIQWFLPSETGHSTLLFTTRNGRVARRYGQHFTVPRFDGSESIALLQQIVGAERITPQKSSVNRLLQLLDGHPLALSVVSHDLEETPSLTIGEYAELLLIEDSRLDYLSDWEDETKDIQKAFELSYRRLPADLQTLYVHLSLLGSDSFDGAAAAAVAAAPLPKIKKQLGQLVALALLEQESSEPRSFHPPNDKSGELRYRYHSLLRLFADGKRTEGEMDLSIGRRRMAEHYIALAASASHFPFHRLRLEQSHLRDALAWAAEVADWSLFAQGIHSMTPIRQGVAGYLDHQGEWSFAHHSLTVLLDSGHLQNEPGMLGETYLKLALFAQRSSDTALVSSSLEAAETHLTHDDSAHGPIRRGYLYLLRAQLARHQDFDDPTGWMAKAIEQIRAWHPADHEGERGTEEGFFQIRYGSFLGQQGDFAGAKQSIQQGLKLLSEQPSPAKSSALTNLGILHAIEGQSDHALEKWQQAMETAHLLGDLRTEGELLNNMGAAESRRGRFYPAIQYKEQALVCARSLGDIHLQLLALCNLGEDYTLLRDFELAQTTLEEADSLAQAHNQQSLLLLVRINQLRLCLDRGTDIENATSLYNDLHQRYTALEEGRRRMEMLRLQIEVDTAVDTATEDLSTESAAQREEALAELLKAAQGEPLEEGLAYRLQGTVYAQQQKWPEAEASFLLSKDIFAEFSPFETARTQLALAQTFSSQRGAEQGLDERYLNQLQSAHHTFSQLGYTAYIELVEALQRK